MVDNINTNTMVGKVVAVCIALLFIVVLAFPIANSLSNMGKEDDGGPITYTNTGDYYYNPTADDDAVHTVQLSEEVENQTETTGSMAISLSVDGSVIYTYTDSRDENTSNEPTYVIIPIGWGSDDIFAVSITEFFFCEINGMSSITPDIKIESSDSGAGSSSSLETPTYPSSSTSECSFTVQNGVITYTNDNDETVTSEYHMDYLITADNSGEYVLADTPFKTDGNSTLYVCVVGYIDDSEHNMSFPAMVYGSMNTSVLTSSPVSVPLQFHGFEGTAQTTATFTSTNDNGLITVSNIESDISMTIPDRDGSYTVSDTVLLNAFVPTTVTVDPSAPVEVTVTNSGQTYTELDDGLYEVNTTRLSDSEMSVTINDVEVATVPYDESGDNPVLCIAFGKTASMWLLSNQTFIAISEGSVTGEQGNHIDNHIWSPRPATEFVMDYIISNSGDYVYCTDSAKCLNTDNLYVYDCVYEVGPNMFYGYASYGTPSQILSNLSANEVITSKQMHSTDNGDYTTITSIDVITEWYDGESYVPYSHTINGFFVPKTFTYTESPDSGSDSGIGGVASTLIKLVPILLIVSLLLVFIVPMVNKPN